MKAMYVNSRKVDYAMLIAQNIKGAETRSKNMLSALVGERVAIVETGKGTPMIVGYVDVDNVYHYKFATASDLYPLTYVPKESKYANNQWFYWLSNARTCKKHPLPANVIRHGRAWCEFEETEQY